MFNNKREIFSFRKYKAYGLASAVIAAFFLAGGVASADEVTSTTTPAVAQTAPSEASTSEVTPESTTPAVASATPTGTAVASTEATVDGATYASDTAKQAVQEHLAPLAQSTTPAPTADQIYKENPAIVSNLTSDDRAVEAENKEAFDKLPDAVRRRVNSVTLEREENGMLGWTASVSGNVHMNAQYFHNDGKDAETEVLYHEIGHAVDGATYKRNADGSEYSLSRDAAVQPLIHKVYPGQVNYEGWASLFGTYMLQKTGQREIKTDLDREINQYFSALMVGFTETNTKINGDFVVTGTDKSEKHLTKSDQVVRAYILDGTYTFKASGTDTVTGAKLVYEAKKQFLEKPTFSQSLMVTKTTDKSDGNTWRYEFDLAPIGGATVGQMSVQQRSKGMIWSGPTSTEKLSGTFKVVTDNIVTDTDTISVTTDRVKGGLYRSDQTPTPTDIRKLTTVPTEAMVGVHNGDTFLDESAVYQVSIPTPNDYWYLANRDDANASRDYERYTDFKYSIIGIPDYLELDPTVPSNALWTRDGDKAVMHITPSQPFNQKYGMDFQPRFRLKASALSGTDKTELMANEKVVKLTWRTDGVLSDGSTYTQELADPTGIHLKTRNEKDPLPEGTVTYGYARSEYPNPLRAASDHSNEIFHVTSSMTNLSRAGKQVSNSNYYLHIPKDQTGDYFNYFKPFAGDFRSYIGTTDVKANDQGLTLKEPLELYGVEADGSITKLASWSRIDSNVQGVNITGNYQKLLVKAPTLRDIRTLSADNADIYSWGADVAYAVDNTRWNNAVEDKSVTTMVNGLRTDFVRNGNTLEDGARVEQKALTAEQMKDTGRVYVHTKADFVHTLRHAIGVGEVTMGNDSLDANLQLGDKAYVGFYGELAPYYQYLRAGGHVLPDRFDTISKTYTSVLVPDGVTITNARVNLTNNMTSPDTAAYHSLTYTNRKGPVREPVTKLVNYQGTGKTLYVYETTPDAGIIDAINKLEITKEGVIDRQSVEMTFEFSNNGTLAEGNHEIQYATIWDKRSEMISPAKDQTLEANGQTLDNVLPTNLQDGFTDKKVSVKKVPFTIAYKKEYASKLYIGEDANSATESEMNGVHLGKVVTVQSRSMNFSTNAGTLTDVIVSVPQGAYKAALAEKVPDGANYKVVYTTDANVKTGTYGEAPTDLSAVTAVRYVFNSPLTLNPGDQFVTNMKVRVPEDAPTNAKATSQLYTSSNGTSFLDANKVTITTTKNLGDVTAYYVDTTGRQLQTPRKQEGLNGTAYTTTKPSAILSDGYTYVFKEVGPNSDSESGQYVVDQHKQVTYVYEKDTLGSVVVRHIDKTGRFLARDELVKDRVPGGEAYTTKPLDASLLTRTTEDFDGKTVTTYTLTKTPENADGVVIAGKSITVVYEYDSSTRTITYGSVIATYKDTEGNELAPQENVQTNVEPGTKYTTEAKTIAPKVDEVDGFTRTTTYTLVATPTNAEGVVEDGTVTTVPYVYRKTVKVNGSVVATYKDREGNELAPNFTEFTNVPDDTAYSTPAKVIPNKVETQTTPEGLTKTITTSYKLVSTPTNDIGNVEGGKTITVPYVYDKTETVTVNGSVIATYKDTEGNELAPQENVKTNVSDGEAYTTTAKTIPSSEVVEKTPEGLTKRTTTSYELTETPANATGTVTGGSVTTVPYVYRKNVTVQTYGSVIATYKDEEGHELTSPEKVITNQPGGTYYEAAPKDIQGSAHATVTPEGRTVTITTYKLIKTPDNEHGDVRDGEIIEVPYVYRKNVEERMVPGDTPSVEIPELKVTQYQTEAGVDVKEAEQGFVDAPNIIGNYQFTGTTNTNEAGDVQTHIYKLIETEVPNEAPSVDVPALNVTRYVNEEGTEIKDAEEGLVPAPSMIGDTYEFTGRTETTEDGTVQTHVYKVVEHEVPNEAPTVEVPALNVTRYVNEEGTEIKDDEEGLVPAPSMIGDTYEFTGRTETTDDGTVQTHVYKVVEHEVPNDAPKRLPEELQITRFVTEDGKDIAPIESGIVGERPVIGDYQYTGRSTHEDGIHTHYYKLIEHEVPNDAPQVDVPALNVTRYVNEEGTEIKDAETGLVPAPSMIGDTYEFTGRTETTEDGTVQTHVYKVVEHQVPGDAPQVDVLKLLVTRFVNETGDEIESATEGFVDARPQIGDYEFTGKTKLNDGQDVQTHVYRLSVHEVPNDAPQVDVPELQITRHVDGDGNDLTEVEKGRQAPKPTIREYQYTDRTTEEHGITTHFYAPIKHEVPNEAPIVEVPELTITRHVNEKGDELLPIEEGSNGPRKTIGDYEYTGRTDVEGGITTHVYAPIRYEVPSDAPIVEVPELQITRHVDEFGNDLTEVEKGRQAPKPTIREYQYTDRTTEEHGITTHFYAPIKHEVPNEAPIVEIPELQITRYVNENGEEIKESEAGFIDAPKTIGGYEFTGKTELNDGKDVQTHIYKLVDKPVTPTLVPKKPETPSPRTPDPKTPETPQLEAPKSIETPKSQFVENELPKTGETNSNSVLVGLSLLTTLGFIRFVKRKREN